MRRDSLPARIAGKDGSGSANPSKGFACAGFVCYFATTIFRVILSGPACSTAK